MSRCNWLPSVDRGNIAALVDRLETEGRLPFHKDRRRRDIERGLLIDGIQWAISLLRLLSDDRPSNDQRKAIERLERRSVDFLEALHDDNIPPGLLADLLERPTPEGPLCINSGLVKHHRLLRERLARYREHHSKRKPTAHKYLLVSSVATTFDHLAHERHRRHSASGEAWNIGIVIGPQPTDASVFEHVVYSLFDLVGLQRPSKEWLRQRINEYRNGTGPLSRC